jgi:N-acetylmuramoyl-L-alanine amidase
MNGTILATLPVGTRVTVHSDTVLQVADGLWVRISFRNNGVTNTGWFRADLLRMGSGGSAVRTYPQKILIDAGHFPGWNSFVLTHNGNTFTYVEGDRMWDLQNFIVEELKNLGFVNARRLRTSNATITTRRDDETPRDWHARENYERGKRSAGFDLLIQLHTDAAAHSTASHVVVFYPMDGRNNTQSLGNSFADAIKTTMGLTGNSRVETHVNDSGGESFAVMRGAKSVNCPRYFITENGFHTTPSTTLWLMQDSNLRRLARAYAEVIKNHFS